MSDKLKKLIEIADHANNSDLIEIWTHSYVAKGNIIKDKPVEGIISLNNAEVYPLFCDCEPECKIHRDWLNIYEDHIISFTVVRKS